MGEHCRPRPTGGAAGILKQRHVFERVDRLRLGRRALLAQQRLEGQHAAAPPSGLGHVASPQQLEHHALQQGQLAREGGDHELRHAARSEQGRGLLMHRLEVERDDGGNASIRRQRRQLLGGVERVEVDHHRAGLENRVIGSDIGRTVRQQKPDAMAAPDAAPLQRRRQPRHVATEVAIAGHRAVEIDARPAGVVLNRFIEQIDETVRRNVFGPVDARWIMVKPWHLRLLCHNFALIFGWRAGFSLVFHVAPPTLSDETVMPRPNLWHKSSRDGFVNHKPRGPAGMPEWTCPW